mmetsp:Transcript_22660/g.74152  ORF Transcript_22660/g.74152 Transcript_22660/m.74152 type:complete len:335 (-) Transcript_22660:301-1305(-)
MAVRKESAIAGVGGPGFPAILHVPLESSVQPVFKGRPLLPTEAFKLGAVECIPAVVVKPVRHVLDKSGAARDGLRYLVCYVANADDILGPDVIHVPRLPLVHDDVESFCNVFNIDETSLGLAVSMDAARLTDLAAHGELRDHFLRKLSGAVDVDAPRHDARKFERRRIPHDQELSCRLGSAIRIGGSERTVLCRGVFLDFSVDFIGRTVEEQPEPRRPARAFQETLSPHDVDIGEDRRALERMIHRRLRCQVQNSVHLVVVHQHGHQLRVPDISMDEDEVGSIFHLTQMMCRAALIQNIQHNHQVLRVLEDQPVYQVATHKPTPPRYQYRPLPS